MSGFACVVIYQNVILLKDQIIVALYASTIICSFIHQLMDIGWLPSAEYFEYCCCENFCTNTCSGSAFNSFVYIPGNGIAGLHGNSVLTFFRNCSIIFLQVLHNFTLLLAMHKVSRFYKSWPILITPPFFSF